LLNDTFPLLSSLLIILLKSPASSISVGVTGRISGNSLLNKRSYSSFRSAPDGAYTFMYHTPFISTAMPRPDGMRLI
jgi:hypothetical protein